MKRFEDESLVERIKIAGALVGVSFFFTILAIQLYSAWQYGAIRVKHHGIVLQSESPGRFWISVAMTSLFFFGGLTAFAFAIWLGASDEKRFKAWRPPMRDETHTRPYDEE